MWQMPHFWLLMLKYGDDYRKAGFPVMNDLFTPGQMKTIVMVWLLASSISSLLLSLFGILHLPAIGYAILFLNIVLLSMLFYQMFIAKQISYRLVFIAANLFMLLVMIALIADTLMK
jgi:protoheme IX farnesyltransferase